MTAGAASPYGAVAAAAPMMGLGAGMAAHASGFATVPPSATIGGPSMPMGMGVGMGMPGMGGMMPPGAATGAGPMASSAWAWKLLAPQAPGEAAPLAGSYAPTASAMPGGGGGAGMGMGTGWPAGPGGYTDTAIAHQYAAAAAFGGMGVGMGMGGPGFPGSAHSSPQPARGGSARPTTAIAGGSPPPAPAEVVADARSRLRDWLTSLSMLYVLPSLVASGYDDIDFIASVGLSDADIDNLGVTAPGHRRKLLHLYGIDKYASVPGRTTGKDDGRAVSPVSAPEAEGEGEEEEGEEGAEEEEGAEGEGEEEGEEAAEEADE